MFHTILGIQNSVSSWSQWPCLVVTTEREEVSPASRGEAAGPGLEINRAVDTVARSPGTQYNLDTPQSPLELETNFRDVTETATQFNIYLMWVLIVS